MKTIIQKLFNESKKEIGTILTSTPGKAISLNQKLKIENSLEQYAFEILYPNEGLSIFRDIYPDNPSIIVIKELNSSNIIDINL